MEVLDHPSTGTPSGGLPSTSRWDPGRWDRHLSWCDPCDRWVTRAFIGNDKNRCSRGNLGPKKDPKRVGRTHAKRHQFPLYIIMAERPEFGSVFLDFWSSELLNKAEKRY